MPWEDLRGEIEDIFSVHSTISDVRLDRYYRWRLNWFRNRQAAKYVEALRFDQADRRQRFREKTKGTYCLYCLGPIIQDYERSRGIVRKFCCKEHSKKASTSCLDDWRLPDGEDSICLFCDRSFKHSLYAPDKDFCSNRCRDELMNGKRVPGVQSGPAKNPSPAPKPWNISGPPIPRGPDPVTLKSIIIEPNIDGYCWECGKWKTLGCTSCTLRKIAEEAA